MGTNNEEKRARAWVLIQATDPQMVVEQVSELDHGDELVVIRVDLVDGGPANIVASMDAALDYYEQAMANIRAIDGIANMWFLRVMQHTPDPPNNASGYITADELSKSESKRAYKGRQDESPGLNPWG